jgi:hypothetical protein
LTLVSVSISYFVIDFVAGLVLITPLSPELVPDEVRHHKLAPDSYSRLEQRDFSYVQRVNNLGLRGADTTWEKPDGTYRILMLGDSFTMGKGVEDEQTFSALLDTRLNSGSGVCGRTRIEVLNGGVDSYAPVLEYLQLSRELYELAPDLVVLNLDNSDLVQEAAYRAEAVYDANGEVNGVPGSQDRVLLNERIRGWIDNHLYMTRLALFYFNQMMGYRDLTVRGVVEQANTEVIRHTLADDRTDRSEQWAQIFDSIERIKQFSDENGIAFVLTAYPWGHQVSDSEWIPGRYSFMPEDARPSPVSLDTVKRLSRERSIELFDMFPVFQSYAGIEPLYFDHDMHWTARGQDLMATGLESRLREFLAERGCD